MSPIDDMNSEQEQEWIDQQRENVASFLSTLTEKLGQQFGRIGEFPAWYEAPLFAIWAIESHAEPGRMGWWVVSGDVPTDYITWGTTTETPQDAVRELGKRWHEIATYMARGERHPSCNIGTPEQWPELSGLLAARADLFARFAADDSLWVYD